MGLIGSQASHAGFEPALFEPGRNCMAIAPAQRAAVIVDGKAYFSAVKALMRRAQRQIVIVGWDFNSGIELEPDNPQPGKPPGLGPWLRQLVEDRPQLEVKLLIWRNSLVYGSNTEPLIPLAWRWWRHPRIEFLLDGRHPLAACHHQKIVVIDGGAAFAGGMDLTERRWDDDTHRGRNPVRVDGDGDPARPVHDVQILVDGPAARMVWQVAADRWFVRTGRALAPVAQDVAWPPHIPVEFHDHEIALARTLPPGRTTPAIREIAALNLDLLRQARRVIYLETQYFASEPVAALLAELLARPDGPEVIIVTNEQWQGWVEKTAMGGKRDALMNRLHAADRHDRLGVYFPVTGRAQDIRIKVHSKVVIVDDSILRIGSSNLNARSLGLDQECDLALVGRDMAARTAIAAIRTRLLAEHLGMAPDAFDAAVARHGSVLRAIRQAPPRNRRLHRFALDGRDTEIPWLSRVLDPADPISLGRIWDRLR